MYVATFVIAHTGVQIELNYNYLHTYIYIYIYMCVSILTDAHMT